MKATQAHGSFITIYLGTASNTDCEVPLESRYLAPHLISKWLWWALKALTVVFVTEGHESCSWTSEHMSNVIGVFAIRCTWNLILNSLQGTVSLLKFGVVMQENRKWSMFVNKEKHRELTTNVSQSVKLFLIS